MSDNKKRILFVCATGIATSTQVKDRVSRFLEEEGIPFSSEQANLASVPSSIQGVDLVVATTKIPYELDVPVIRGLPLITGVGEDKTLAAIKSVLADD